MSCSRIVLMRLIVHAAMLFMAAIHRICAAYAPQLHA